MAKRDIPETDPNNLRNKFPGNSYAKRDKEQTDISSDKTEDKPRQVAKGKVKKQGLFRKFARYIVEDTIESARERTLMDIVVPGIKTLIFDTGTEILDLMLFGGEGDLRRSRGSSSRSGKTSYSRFYDEKNHKKSSKRESYRELACDPDDIILDTRGEARAVLEELDRIIFKYGQASIADFYDIVGVTSDWTDSRYGWTSLKGAGIRPVREGFLIELPRTEVLDD